MAHTLFKASAVLWGGIFASSRELVLSSLVGLLVLNHISADVDLMPFFEEVRPNLDILPPYPIDQNILALLQ